MALALYTLASVYLNGGLLSEEASVKIDRDSRAQQILTVAKGLAGMSPGAQITTIDVDSAVPAADFEVNPGKFLNLTIVELTVFAAGRTLTCKGFIVKDNFSHAVNSESKLNFNFIGGPSDWK